MKKPLLTLIVLLPLGLIACFLLIQVIPFGRSHSNPPVVLEPNWDNLQTRALAQRACFDCHSNETVWPWYSNIAPVSWLVQRDVDEGRSKLNFSEWRRFEEAAEIGEVIAGGEMPPMNYYPTHPEARLTAGEQQQLIRGLEASLRATP